MTRPTVPIPQGPSSPSQTGGSAFAAQVLGQGGARRGLKGGQPVIEAAQSAYLGTEWSGPSDRRTRAGRLKKTEV